MLFKWCRFVGRIALYIRQKVHRWALEEQPTKVQTLLLPESTNFYTDISSTFFRVGLAFGWWD